MGIVIHMRVSKSITEGEWGRIYEESLKLVEAFPLAEMGEISYAGQQVACAVRTREREVPYRSGTKRGWCTEMDYETLNWAESYYLLKDFVDNGNIDSDAGDAIMGAALNCMDYEWKQEKFDRTYSLWGAKTQGEPYHMYLLSIACMIEDRLGEKAFIYGDITRGQCQKAVEMANQYLQEPIRLPASCDMGRLYERIQQLPIEENEKMNVFEHFYLGEQDKTFYDFIQNQFHADAIRAYWEKRFANSMIGTMGFVKDLKAYLSSGAGLAELCGIVCMEDREGNPQYEKFINAVMDSKLHIKEKNTKDYLDIPQGERQPYGIWRLEAELVYGSAHNRKVERYIPIGEIRQALRNGIGDKCDTNQYIDQYLEKEAAAPEINALKENITDEELMEMAETDAAEVFSQLMNKKTEKMLNLRKQYAHLDYVDLNDYKKGSTITPELKEAVGKSFQI
ncbi:MAG: hypothetical protein K2M91_02350 [Lachnospiraceae bacterium]|nr:hypothetical protein [Lachnospiraceae bacterium]